jgi:hypothetical protein
MKKNLFFCLMLLSSCRFLSALNSFETYYHEYNASRTLEQRFFYDYYPAPMWLLSQRGSVEFGKNDKFQQLDKIYHLVWSASKESKYIDQEIHLGYDYFYNRSEPLESQGVTRIHKRTAGYDVLFRIVDSLTIENDMTFHYEGEDDRYHSSHTFISEGLQNSQEISYNARIGIHDLVFHANYDQADLEFQWGRRVGGNLAWQFETDKQNWSSNFSFDDSRDKIYTLQPRENTTSIYQHTDTQNRQGTRAGFNYDRILPYQISVHATNQFSYMRNHLDFSISKNNDDLTNLASLTFKMPFWKDFQGFVTTESQYENKEFKLTANSRSMEDRRVQTGVSYRFRDADSLYAIRDLELSTTKYEESHGLDNDVVTDSWLFGIESNFKHRILWRTLFSRTAWKEIYIDSSLSGNNSIRTSYTLQPGMDFVVGDCILLQQNYQLRADYDDFTYSTQVNIKDRFYRQLVANYRVEYNDYPIVRRYNFKAWEKLPSRLINMNYFSVSAGFRYEHNETGDRDIDTYLISTQNSIRSFDITLQKFYKQTEIKIRPKYTFGDIEEMDILLDTNYYFRNDSFVKISINPNGRQWRKLIWRATIALSYEY